VHQAQNLTQLKPHPYALQQEVHRQQSLRHVYNPHSYKADCSSATFKTRIIRHKDVIFHLRAPFPQLMRFVFALSPFRVGKELHLFIGLCFDGFF
jgi:hypothetical protein